MKYRALREDKEIFVDFLSAILKEKSITRNISFEEERKLQTEILEMIELGFGHKEIRETLNTTEYRIVKAIKNSEVI